MTMAEIAAAAPAAAATILPPALFKQRYQNSNKLINDT